MISDYVNVINRNKLLHVSFVRRWYNGNNKTKQNKKNRISAWASGAVVKRAASLTDANSIQQLSVKKSIQSQL